MERYGARQRVGEGRQTAEGSRVGWFLLATLAAAVLGRFEVLDGCPRVAPAL